MKEKLGHWDFEDKHKGTIENQNKKLEELKSNEIKEMFEGADSDQDKLIDFGQFIDSLKNIQIIPIKPQNRYC